MVAKKYQSTHKSEHWLKHIRRRAMLQGVPFDLTVADLVIPDVCPLLGIPMSHGLDFARPDSPSVDKIIPGFGYVRGNVRIISHMANSMKRNATPGQLLAFAANIPAYLRGVLAGCSEAKA